MWILWMALLAVSPSAQQTQSEGAVTGLNPPAPPGRQIGRLTLRGADGSVIAHDRNALCQARIRRVEESGFGAVSPPVASANADEKVRMYYLLQRTQNGCQDPVIAIDNLPGADAAVGRVISPGQTVTGQ